MFDGVFLLLTDLNLHCRLF